MRHFRRPVVLSLLFFAVPCLGEGVARILPVTIAASVYGDSVGRESWHLSVCSSGDAELTVGYGKKMTRRALTVSSKQFEDLRKTLDDTDFMYIAGRFGGDAPGMVYRSISITIGYRSAFAQFRNFDTLESMEAVQQARQCLRVRNLVRSWIDEVPDIADFREQDDASLANAEKLLRRR